MKQAFFILNENIEPIKDNLEFINYTIDPINHRSNYLNTNTFKETDVLISIFKEDGKFIISIGTKRYGINLKFEELEKIYNFIKSNKLKQEVIAQLV